MYNVRMVNTLEDVSIIFEDSDIIVINKPAGIVVHPGTGDTGPTVVDWLINHSPVVTKHDWLMPERLGIVHRLDKNTSGILILAKNPTALENLQAQFKQRLVSKEYYALVFGQPKPAHGTIETFIDRDKRDRQRQAVSSFGSDEARRAITNYQTLASWPVKGQIITSIAFFPKTGRTHQLRAHAKHLGTPILGDQVYTIKPANRFNKLLKLTRQLLHAKRITFAHPTTNQTVVFEAPLASDILELAGSIKQEV